MTTPVTILGAGISGLSTAWFLQQRGVTPLVLESRGRCGGNLRTGRAQGYLFEHGPNSTLQKAGAPEDALGRLVAQVGLEEALLEANPAAAKRFVLKQGILHPLPASPLGFAATPLFSMGAKLRLLAEPFIRRGQGEESIAQFVTRRLGREFLDYAIEPFISGVYAGNPATLSVAAAVPKIYALEQQYGSLIRGAFAMGKAMKGAGMPKGRLVSFREGMESLPLALAARLPAGALHTGVVVAGLEPRADGSWSVHWQNGRGESVTTHTGRVVLSLPAPAAAPLLATFCPAAAQLVAAIPYAPIASVALGFARGRVAHPLDGFGFLIPRREGVTTLGALFSSTLFPGRAPEGHVLITAFIGGTIQPRVMELEERALVAQVLADLTPCLGLSGEPHFVSLTRYTRAIPQYTLGHLARLVQLDQHLAPYANLLVRANWRNGISVSDCIRNGEEIAP